MPADHSQHGAFYKARPDRSRGQHQGIPAHHWGPAPEEDEGHEQGDSLDAFVVETRLVPASLSQIPDHLPDNVSWLHIFSHTCHVTVTEQHADQNKQLVLQASRSWLMSPVVPSCTESSKTFAHIDWHVVCALSVIRLCSAR